MHADEKQLHFLWCTLEYNCLGCLTRGKIEQIDGLKETELIS
jgi:hypothetical protein